VIFLLIICFFIPFLKIGAFIFPISYIIITIISIQGFVDIFKKKLYRLIILFLTIHLFYSIINALFGFLINSNFDFRGLIGAIIGFVILGTSHYLNLKLLKLDYSKVVSLFNYPLFINNVIIILLFNIEKFNIFFYKVISVNPRMLDYPVPRYSGLGYDGFSYASTLNAIYFLIIFFIILTGHKKILNSTKYLIIINLLLTIITTILIGRTGVGLILIGVVILLLFQFYYSSLANKFKFLINSSVRIAFFSISFIFIGNLTIDLPMIEYLTYGFKFYSETFGTGEINDTSINDIRSNMFFLPESVISIFFGEGNFGRGAKYIASDLGLILGIHGYGIIGLLLFLLSICSFIYIIAFKINNRFSKAAVSLITSLLLLVNLKDYYIFYPIGHYILLFTFVMYIAKYEPQKE
jgi:hypothetical protein